MMAPYSQEGEPPAIPARFKPLLEALCEMGRGGAALAACDEQRDIGGTRPFALAEQGIANVPASVEHGRRQAPAGA